MGALKRTPCKAVRAYQARGRRTGNSDPENWRGTESHKVSKDQTWKRARQQRIAIYQRSDRLIWDSNLRPLCG